MTNLQTNQKAKEVVVNELRDKLSRTKSVVLVSSRGLTVEQDTVLRASLRKASGVDYKVYKNSMMARAIEGTEFAGLAPHLAGPTAVAFSYEDATAAAAAINKHLKAMPLLTFKASAIDGTVYDENGTKAIADIPSRDVLLSRLLGSLKSPMASFARVVNAVAEKDADGAPSPAPAAEEAPVAETPAVEETPVATEEAAPEAPAVDTAESTETE